MRKLVIFGAAVCLAAFLGSAVWPETTISQDARPTTANNCLSIPVSAFQAQDDSYDFWVTSFLSNDTGSGTYRAPVNLPQGSTIRKIWLQCKDFHNSLEIILRLKRMNREPDTYTAAEVTTSGSDGGWRIFKTTAVSPRYVNNFKNTYFIEVILPGSVTYFQLAQVKIFFDTP